MASPQKTPCQNFFCSLESNFHGEQLLSHLYLGFVLFNHNLCTSWSLKHQFQPILASNKCVLAEIETDTGLIVKN